MRLGDDVVRGKQYRFRGNILFAYNTNFWFMAYDDDKADGEADDEAAVQRQNEVSTK